MDISRTSGSEAVGTRAESWPADACLSVLSAHLGDAALSCGSFLAEQARQRPVTVMTLFTAADGGRPSLAARAFLRRHNARSAAGLYARGRTEDRLALRSIGVTGIHFNLPDALFRRRASSRPMHVASVLLPELTNVYPTTRRHVARGRISPHDQPLLAALHKRVLVATAANDVILAPLGLGGQVDDVLAHEVGKGLSSRRKVGWYADQPGEGLVPAGCRRVKVEAQPQVKADLAAGYGSFADRPPHASEEYVYLPSFG